MKIVEVRKKATPGSVIRLKYCDTFVSRLLGLMFTREIDIDGGIQLAGKRDSIANTSIHMMFMRYDIEVVWVSEDLVVVDKTLAKKWGLFYSPKHPAMHVLELHPSKLSEFEIGDQLLIHAVN